MSVGETFGELSKFKTKEILMFKFNLDNGLKANIWVDEEPIISRCGYSELLVQEKVEMFATSKKLTIELFVPRAHNNYALLGVDFLASENGEVEVKLGIDEYNNEIYNASIALPFDIVVCGITDEFKEGIIHSVDSYLKGKRLPSGIVNYNIFAYGKIGSSVNMFKSISDMLLSLLIYEDIDEVIISKVIKENII